MISEVLSKGMKYLPLIITKGNIKTLLQEAKEKTQEDDILKKINKNTYNGLILEQDDTVCLQIVE